MAQMKGYPTTLELIYDRAEYLYRSANSVQKGKRKPEDLVWDVLEVANKIMQTIEEERS